MIIMFTIMRDLVSLMTVTQKMIAETDVSLEEISTQNGPFNFYSNSMSSCVSQ